MAPSKKIKSQSSTRTPSTRTSDSYDGGSESLADSYSTSTARSRLSSSGSSVLNTGSTVSGFPKRKTFRSRRHSSGSSAASSRASSRASSPGASLRSYKSNKSNRSISKKSTPKKAIIKAAKPKSQRPVGEIQMIKKPEVKELVRQFVIDYTKDPEFETFSLTVDDVPFVAISLMNADDEVRRHFLKKQPPTPMKKHDPVANKPRKRRLSQCTSHCSSTGRERKSVRFTDEGSRRSSSERDLSKTISDSMIETDRKYHELWHDRVEDNK